MRGRAVSRDRLTEPFVFVRNVLWSGIHFPAGAPVPPAEVALNWWRRGLMEPEADVANLDDLRKQNAKGIKEGARLYAKQHEPPKPKRKRARRRKRPAAPKKSNDAPASD